MHGFKFPSAAPQPPTDCLTAIFGKICRKNCNQSISRPGLRGRGGMTAWRRDIHVTFCTINVFASVRFWSLQLYMPRVDSGFFGSRRDSNPPCLSISPFCQWSRKRGGRAAVYYDSLPTAATAAAVAAARAMMVSFSPPFHDPHSGCRCGVV